MKKKKHLIEKSQHMKHETIKFKKTISEDKYLKMRKIVRRKTLNKKESQLKN